MREFWSRSSGTPDQLKLFVRESFKREKADEDRCS